MERICGTAVAGESVNMVTVLLLRGCATWKHKGMVNSTATVSDRRTNKEANKQWHEGNRSLGCTNIWQKKLTDYWVPVIL